MGKVEGYRVKEYGMPVKRYCQTLDLKNNPELIAEYRKYIVVERPGRRFGKVSSRLGFWRWRFTSSAAACS